jgi:hypothetical protein
MYRVRFHLALGENYRMWQIRGPEQVFYADPDTVSLRMTNCRLRNQRGTANKIFAGEDKTVCAWVECETVHVGVCVADQYDAGQQLIYNPRCQPFWTSPETGANLDGERFPTILSQGRSLFEVL